MRSVFDVQKASDVMDPVQFTGPSSLDVENLLPQSLRDGMLPIQQENLQLLVSLIQNRLSSRQLKWHNEQLSAEMEKIKGGSSSPSSPSNPFSPAAPKSAVEERMDGMEDALGLCVAELIALIVSWQRQMEGEQRKDLSVEYETRWFQQIQPSFEVLSYCIDLYLLNGGRICMCLPCCHDLPCNYVHRIIKVGSISLQY